MATYLVRWDVTSPLKKPKNKLPLLFRAQILGLMSMGYTTTSSVLAWTIYLLSRNNDVVYRLFTEIDTISGGNPEYWPEYE